MYLDDISLIQRYNNFSNDARLLFNLSYLFRTQPPIHNLIPSNLISVLQVWDAKKGWCIPGWGGFCLIFYFSKVLRTVCYSYLSLNALRSFRFSYYEDWSFLNSVMGWLFCFNTIQSRVLSVARSLCADNSHRLNSCFTSQRSFWDLLNAGVIAFLTVLFQPALDF